MKRNRTVAAFAVLVAIIVSLTSVAPPVFAQTYPTRPIKVVVPLAAGGPLDIVGRAVSAKS